MSRNTGTTSQQMLKAPKGSLFICPKREALAYTNALAVHLDRGDLVITAPHILDDGARRLRGRRYPAIIVDHACDLTNRQQDTLDRVRETVVRRSA